MECLRADMKPVWKHAASQSNACRQKVLSGRKVPAAAALLENLSGCERRLVLRLTCRRDMPCSFEAAAASKAANGSESAAFVPPSASSMFLCQRHSGLEAGKQAEELRTDGAAHPCVCARACTSAPVMLRDAGAAFPLNPSRTLKGVRRFGSASCRRRPSLGL